MRGKSHQLEGALGQVNADFSKLVEHVGQQKQDDGGDLSNPSSPVARRQDDGRITELERDLEDSERENQELTQQLISISNSLRYFKNEASVLQQQLVRTSVVFSYWNRCAATNPDTYIRFDLGRKRS